MISLSVSGLTVIWRIENKINVQLIITRLDVNFFHVIITLVTLHSWYIHCAAGSVLPSVGRQTCTGLAQASIPKIVE